MILIVLLLGSLALPHLGSLAYFTGAGPREGAAWQVSAPAAVAEPLVQGEVGLSMGPACQLSIVPPTIDLLDRQPLQKVLPSSSLSPVGIHTLSRAVIAQSLIPGVVDAQSFPRDCRCLRTPSLLEPRDSGSATSLLGTRMSSVACLISLLGLVAFDTVMAVPITSRQAAESACNKEGLVTCSGSTYQTCASGIWSVEMPLAPGTDCTVFGSLLSGAISFTSALPGLVPAAPVPVAPAAPAPATPAITIAPPVEPTLMSSPTQPSEASPTGDSSGSSGAANSLPFQTYSGPASQFPPESSWIPFDHMWNLNGPVCTQMNGAANAQLIHDDILKAAAEFGVDARVILAVILEESTCMLGVPTTAGAVSNPGLMQSHNGVGYDGTANSVFQMIKDGTDGTLQLGPQRGGNGLKQLIAQFGLYPGLRAYNSGENGVNPADLSECASGKATYVSEIANRLVGAMVAH